MSLLSAGQQEVVRLLRADDGKRELYEGASNLTGKFGSGICHVTYGPHPVHITVREAEQLEAQGLLRRKWAEDPTCNCWVLA